MELPVGEIERLVLGQFGARSDSLQKFEPKVCTQRFFDYLVVALAGPGSSYLGRPEQLVLNVDRCFSSHPFNILVEMHLSVKTAHNRSPIRFTSSRARR